MILMGFLAAELGLKADLSEYTFATRMSFTHQQTTNTVMAFLNVNNYTSPTFIIDESKGFFEELGMVVEQTLHSTRPEFFATFKFLWSKVFNISYIDDVFNSNLFRSRSKFRPSCPDKDSEKCRFFSLRTSRSIRYSQTNYGETKSDDEQPIP